MGCSRASHDVAALTGLRPNAVCRRSLRSRCRVGTGPRNEFLYPFDRSGMRGVDGVRIVAGEPAATGHGALAQRAPPKVRLEGTHGTSAARVEARSLEALSVPPPPRETRRPLEPPTYAQSVHGVTYGA